MKKLFIGSSLLLLLAACGSSVDVGSNSSSSSSGAAGAGGETTSGTGGSTSIACGRTNGHLSIEVKPFDGNLPTCDFMSQGPVEWVATGEVLKSDSATGTLLVEQCPPNADCAPMHTTVIISGDQLTLDVPIGAFVQVSYVQTPAWASCTQRILIENIPGWGGLNNPVSTSNRIYLTGAEGELGGFGTVPFTVDRAGLGCGNQMGCGWILPDDYALVVEGTKVGMGHTDTIAASGRNFTFRNLRSYQTEYCDDYWNWAFWAVEQ